jgi:hypothetical protein
VLYVMQAVLYRAGYDSAPTGSDDALSPAPPPASSGPPVSTLGPSFDCSKVTTPLPQFICARRDLSRTDLEFAQAYYALRWQAGPARSQALKQEAIDFQNRVAQQCGIAPSGGLPSNSEALAVCLKHGYEDRRSTWLSRLGGAAL